MNDARGVPAWAVQALLAIWVLPSLWVVAHAGRLQYNDYYSTLAKVVDGGRLTRDPVRWLTVKSNEHTVTVSALIYAANLRLTHGDNRALSAWAVAMMALTALGLWRLTPEELRRGGAVGALVALAVGALAFTPAAIHNVVMGFSGVMWLTANALAVWAVVVLVRGGRDGGWAAPAVAAGLGLLAAFTYSTGIAVWPMLVLVGAAREMRWRRLAPVLLCALADLVFEIVTYTRPASLPPPGTGGGTGLLAYLAAYLGGPLGLGWVSAVAGFAALTAGLALGWVLWREAATRTVLAPWLGVGAYALVNATATGVARIGVGGARSSRYATLAALYWIALLVAATWLVERIPRSRARLVGRAALDVGAAILLVAMWVRGVQTARGYLELAAGQPLAELALVHGVMDPEAFHAAYTGAVTPQEVAGVRRMLQSLHHVPFDRPPWVRFGGPVPGRATGPCPGVSLGPVVATPLGGGMVRLEGVLKGGPGRFRVALVDDRGRVVGAGVRMPAPWPDHPDQPGNSARWAGYVEEPGTGDGVHMVLFRKGTWCSLGPLAGAGEGPSPERAPLAFPPKGS